MFYLFQRKREMKFFLRKKVNKIQHELSFPNRRWEVRGIRKKHTRLEELRKKDTLQSIDNTLKRIEVILRDGQNSPAKILQDAIEASLSQPQEHSLVLPLTIPDLSQLLEQKDLQIK